MTDYIEIEKQDTFWLVFGLIVFGFAIISGYFAAISFNEASLVSAWVSGVLFICGIILIAIYFSKTETVRLPVKKMRSRE